MMKCQKIPQPIKPKYKIKHIQDKLKKKLNLLSDVVDKRKKSENVDLIL